MIKKFEGEARTLLICGDICGILLSEKRTFQNNVYESIFLIKTRICVFMHVCVYTNKENSVEGQI